MTFAGFANPLGLLGLLSLPVILLLHLLRQRTATYQVSSLSLWSFLDVEVRGSQLQRIPVTMLLILDLLIATLLSLAWAQPQLRVVRRVQQPQHVILLLDVSNSMASTDVYPSRFGQARNEVVHVLNSLMPHDRATVITFAAEVAEVGDTRQVALPQLIEQVEQLLPIQLGHDGLAPALALAAAVMEPDVPATIQIFSDAAFAQPELGDLAGRTHWSLFGSSGDNQVVLELAVAPAGAREWQVFMRAANLSHEPVRQAATLWVNGREIDRIALPMEAQAAVTQIWTLPLQPETVEVTLINRDALHDDNRAALSLAGDAPVRVTLVSPEPGRVGQALAALPGLTLVQLTPEQYYPGLEADLILFHQTLPAVWPPGHVAVIEPPAGHDLLSVGAAVEVTGAAVPVNHPLLQDVGLGGVRWGHAFSVSTLPAGFEILLQAGEQPLLAVGQIEATTLYLLLPELSSGNFTRHPAFPILMANLVAAAGEPVLPGRLPLGETLALPTATLYPHLQIHTPGGEMLDLSNAQQRVPIPLAEPGFYSLQLEDVDGNLSELSVGVNAGSLAEAEVQPGDWAEVPAPLAVAAVSDEEERVSLMPWLLGLAILILIWEARLAWK